MSAAAKLYELAARCPRCGERPRLRATRRQVEKWRDEPPDELVQTYQCSFDFGRSRKCNTIYALTAAAFQGAVKLDTSAPPMVP